MKLITLNQVAPWTDDFFFLRVGDSEAIVICNPQDSVCLAPAFLRSKKTLDEHIELVNKCHLKRAMIVAEDINFLRCCPSLEELDVYPSFNARDFDFSPLYDMPNLRKLVCGTMYGPEEDRVSYIDYSRFTALENLVVSGQNGHENVHLTKGLKFLAFENKQPTSKTLVGAFDGEKLEELSVSTSSICSLEGLENAKQLRSLTLAYNRKLVDISGITRVKDTLVHLDIENCGKITDFSPLSHLHKLESLRLVGSNVLPNLSFIRNMPHLRSLVFRMTVSDGDLSVCLPIPYVSIQNKKHYSHKDKDFSKQL